MCDAAPDGTSTPVTRSAVNLSVRNRRDQSLPSKPVTTEDVGFGPAAIGRAVPPGPRIRLWLAPSPPSSWP
ncbi:CocE/NonD family hydrolase C-terminal non-catalytic domain-containing protein [Streptomyces sp. NPDC005195]|uniref:CocE/NonD family hydrolase C-terminal non-catalytic domain-containing protein n=1 Tax=Streptomyces sp. NPDC005195 TaxID=3154561 RepID=UPI0033A45681